MAKRRGEDATDALSLIRNDLTPEQRNEDMYMSIDPGFVHIRAIEAILGETGMRHIDEAIKALPSDLPGWVKQVRIDHIYKNHMIYFCDALKVYTLGELLGHGKGHLFCSIEELDATPGVYNRSRVITYVKTSPAHGKYRVRLEYDSNKVTSDTIRMQLDSGSELAVIAKYHGRDGDELIFHPLVIGAPWLTPKTKDSSIRGPEWFSHEFFENFVEDIDEFAKVGDEPKPSDASIMQGISEAAFKQCVTEILNEHAGKDWGGETSDHFSANVHLNGRRTTAAFVFKGPAKFSPMQMTHLGKNGDQIYRLAQEPAQLLIVQHCHDILPAVRATLRAFAVKPGQSRRYCLIDGRDSLRLLKAYGKLDRALELTKAIGTKRASTNGKLARVPTKIEGSTS